jgi:hypothetical protein
MIGILGPQGISGILFAEMAYPSINYPSLAPYPCGKDLTYNLKMRRAFERPSSFIVNLIVELPQPSVQVWVIVADHLPVAHENGVVCDVETNHSSEESVVDY